jgi:SPP1 gp7 family putative phage head morphogenesis protein
MIRCERKIYRAVRRALSAFTKEVAQRIVNGMDPIPLDAGTRWRLDLYNAQIRDGMTAAYNGWKGAEELLPTPATKGSYIHEDAFIGIPEGDDFLMSPTPQGVNDFFDATSAREAGTYNKKVNTVFNRIKNEQSINPETGRVNLGGLQIGKIANELQREMNDWSPSYARMIARTGVVFASNAGAMERYRKANIKKKQWWTIEDDLTCPWCESLHEEIISIEKHFLEANAPLGATVLDANEEEREVFMEGPAWGVGHPPLHPNCRCRVIPFMTQEDILAIGANLGPGARRTSRKPRASTTPRPKRRPKKKPPAEASFENAGGSDWEYTDDPKVMRERLREQGIGNVTTPDGNVTDDFLLDRTNAIGDELSSMRKRFPKMKGMMDEMAQYGGVVDDMQIYNTPGVPWAEDAGGLFERSSGVMQLGVDTATTSVQQMKGLGGYNLMYGKDGTYAYRQLFRHEFGHSMHSLAIREQISNPKIKKSWLDIWESHDKKWWGKKISTYAATDGSECFAECFTVYTNPMYGKTAKYKLPKDVEKWFDAVFKGK